MSLLFRPSCKETVKIRGAPLAVGTVLSENFLLIFCSPIRSCIFGKTYILNKAFVLKFHTDEAAPKSSEIKEAPLKVKCVCICQPRINISLLINQVWQLCSQNDKSLSSAA